MLLVLHTMKKWVVHSVLEQIHVIHTYLPLCKTYTNNMIIKVIYHNHEEL